MVKGVNITIGMIIFLNHGDRLFCDVFETPNNNNDYFTIITIIGPTINCSDASLKSITRSEKGTFLETSKRINYKSNFRPDEKHMGPALEILHNIHIGCRYHFNNCSNQQFHCQCNDFFIPLAEIWTAPYTFGFTEVVHCFYFSRLWNVSWQTGHKMSYTGRPIHDIHEY